MNNVPVIVHHEGYADYLKICLDQAKKFNNRVILFGNRENKDLWDDWVDIEGFSSDLYSEFSDVYKPITPYSATFDEQIFKRLFILQKWMGENGKK